MVWIQSFSGESTSSLHVLFQGLELSWWSKSLESCSVRILAQCFAQNVKTNASLVASVKCFVYAKSALWVAVKHLQTRLAMKNHNSAHPSAGILVVVLGDSETDVMTTLLAKQVASFKLKHGVDAQNDIPKMDISKASCCKTVYWDTGIPFV